MLVPCFWGGPAVPAPAGPAGFLRQDAHGPWRRSVACAAVLGRTARCDKLERFLSKAGVLSRREAARRVRAGQVRVNGAVVLDPFHAVNTADVVVVDGFGPVTLPDWKSRPPRVVLFNKPPGVVTSLRTASSGASDLHLKPLQDALPEPYQGQLRAVPALRPVGRLDANSVGLLLLTDANALAAFLTSDESVDKEYLLRVVPLPSEISLDQLRAGVHINDGKRRRTMPCSVRLVQSESEKAVLRFVLHEGRNRQLRQMCQRIGLNVEWLMRTRVGPFVLGSLPLGAAREATDNEMKELKELQEMRPANSD
ncbi:unnamed protein product [Effrenium voratum]|nr:unnamed protein product [Effrenium voratum]